MSRGRLGDAAGGQAYGQVAGDGGQGLHQHPSPHLTNEHGEEKLHDGDVQDRGRQVQEPVWCHGEESEEQQEKEQAVSVLLHLQREPTVRSRRLLPSSSHVPILKTQLIPALRNSGG